LRRSDGSFLESALAEEVLKTIERLMATTTTFVDVKAVLARLQMANDVYKAEPRVITLIHGVTASLVEKSLPAGYKGLQKDEKNSLSAVCDRAVSRWTHRNEDLQAVIVTPDLSVLLLEAEFRILVSQIYRSGSVQDMVEDAIRSGDTPLLQNLDQIIRAVDALCDCRGVMGSTVDLGQHGLAVFEQAIRIVVDDGAEVNDRRISASCAARLIETSPASFETFMTSLAKSVGRVPIDRFTSQTVMLATLSRKLDPVKSKAACHTVIEHGMRWVVRYYAEDLPQSRDSIACVESLGMSSSTRLRPPAECFVHGSSSPTPRVVFVVEIAPRGTTARGCDPAPATSHSGSAISNQFTQVQLAQGSLSSQRTRRAIH
jgi:hypothetical protein